MEKVKFFFRSADTGERTKWSGKKCAGLAAVLTISYALAVSLVYSWVYTLNDDRFMKELLSGVYYGTEDAHLLYIMYPFAAFVKRLYLWFPGWDWYGIVLIGVNLLCLFLLLYRVLRIPAARFHRWMLLGIVLALYTAVWLPRLAAFTYTTVAGMAGATALFWYAGEESRGASVVVYCLALLSFSIRTAVLLMLLPFAGVLFFHRFFSAQPLRGGKPGTGMSRFLKALRLPLLLLASISLVFMAHLFSYDRETWRDFTEDQGARLLLYDYCGAADYREHEAFYREIGVSEDTWQALAQYNLVVDEALDTECLNAIAAYSEKAYENSMTFSQRVVSSAKSAYDGLMHNGCEPMNWLGIMIFALLLLESLCRGDWKFFRTVAAIWAVELLLLFWLGWRGRIPERVVESLLLGALLAVVALRLKEGLLPPEGTAKKAVICLLLLSAALPALRQSVKCTGHNVRQVAARAEDYQTILDYCGSDGELFFLEDVYSVVGYADVFTLRDETEEMNCLPLGDWFCGSPMYVEKLAREGITDLSQDLVEKGNIRILCKDYYNVDYLRDYYLRHGRDVVLEVVDQIQLTNERMDVYRLYERQEEGQEG